MTQTCCFGMRLLCRADDRTTVWAFWTDAPQGAFSTEVALRAAGFCGGSSGCCCAAARHAVQNEQKHHSGIVAAAVIGSLAALTFVIILIVALVKMQRKKG